MLDNNIQNNTQNENEKVVQNGIQNVHQKFTARQNELRLYIINFTIDNKRPYNLESDKEVTLQVLQMDAQEYEEIIQCLIDKGLFEDYAEYDSLCTAAGLDDEKVKGGEITFKAGSTKAQIAKQMNWS